MQKNNSGFGTIIAVLLIFVVGLAVGGVFYYLGSQNITQVLPTPLPEATALPEVEVVDDEVSELLEESVIESELDATVIDSVEKDLLDVEKEAESLN